MSNVLPINLSYGKDKDKVDNAFLNDFNEIDEYIYKNSELFDEYIKILSRNIFGNNDEGENLDIQINSLKVV